MLETQSLAQPDVFAAVDLGSNSFHMVVARFDDGQFIVVDRLRESVRLASGLTPGGGLSGGCQEKALACLRRFGQKLRDLGANQVRVVGTSALRCAHSATAFLDAAEQVLGYRVEVISGMEEARLIYAGVSHHMEPADGATLVVDIGGGSTELIIGSGYEPRRLASVGIGCVELSDRFFGDGRLTLKQFEAARLAVLLELQPTAESFLEIGWMRAVGSSGTAKAAAEVAQDWGLVDHGVTVPALEAIIRRLVETHRIDALDLPGLGPDRASIFPGGIVILVEIMRTLAVGQLEISDGALREGLLHDMLDRLRCDDLRERTVRAMQRRCSVDEEQACRVETTAAALFDLVRTDWGLHDAHDRRLLQWAARLHEVGLDVARSQHQRHGEYLLANADLPGFARGEQRLLSVLVRFHRRKLEQFTLDGLPAARRASMFCLVVLLRLAVLLNRARSPCELPCLRMVAGNDSLEVRCLARWYADHPVVVADLRQEQVQLAACGFELRVCSLDALDAGQEASAS